MKWNEPAVNRMLSVMMKRLANIIFYDCSPESPIGRRSIYYDLEGLESRKKYKPENNAIDILTEKQYRELQQRENSEAENSNWLKTPADFRELGALFGDFRCGRVFVYHNGAQSYYGARGFRGSLRI